MNNTPSFHLQRNCMVEVVRQLIQCGIPNNLEWHDYDQWVKTEEQVVKGKIQKLKIPTVFQEALRNMVNPIFKYFQNAIDTFYEHTLYTPISSIHKCIRMKPWGTVDMKRSAEALIDLSVEELPKLMHYELSRIFCLQDRFTSCYEDLDEADRISLPSSLDHMYVAEGELRLLSNFEYAVLDGNEVAARYFWSAEEKLQPSAEFIMQIRAKKLKIRPDTLSDLYLFLLSCYPDDESLREALLNSLPFLVSLFEWPYQQKLLELFYSMPDQRRYINLGRLMHAMYYNFHHGQFDSDYLDTVRQFLKKFLAKDKGLTSPNAQTGSLLISYLSSFDFSRIEALDRSDEFWDGWKTPWQTIALSTIDIILFHGVYFKEKNFPFLRVLLEFLEKNDKVRHCELRANDVDSIICSHRLSRLDWLFEECLTHEQSTAIRNRLWANKNLWNMYRYLYLSPYPDTKHRLNVVMKFYRISQDKVEEMMMKYQFRTHVPTFTLGWESH